MFLQVCGRHVGTHLDGQHDVSIHLYKFAGKVSRHIFHRKNCCDLNLGEGLCIFTFFLFSDSGLYQLNAVFTFILIYFEWCDTENQQQHGMVLKDFKGTLSGGITFLQSPISVFRVFLFRFVNCFIMSFPVTVTGSLIRN